MSNDDDLVKALRAELDDLVADVPAVPTSPPPAPVGGLPASRRWMPLAVAAVSLTLLVGGLIVIANRDTDEATTDVPPSTEPPAVTNTPPATTSPEVPQLYETVGTVIEDATHGPRVCLEGTLESYPPQCAGGPDLVGWSWEAIDGEAVEGSTTWVVAYITGTYDAATNALTVADARLAVESDLRDELQNPPPVPDYSVPCPEPAEGWPARNQEWPGDQISAIDGYAGSWVDESQQVMTVKFTGDLAVAEAAVRQYYSDALCVVAAEHTEAELLDIQGRLQAMSSIRFVSVQVFADATGEWVTAFTVVPEPQRQTAFDAEFGPGVVRLESLMVPISIP